MVKFEDKYLIIEKEIEKRRHKWTLKAVAWLCFDDVKQLILIHIWKQFGKWDQDKEFLPWVNRVISNQIINLLRNLYMNMARPCISCCANEGEDRCRIYE